MFRANRASRRVSSAAITSASASTARSRADAARKKYGGLAAVTVKGVVKEVFIDKMGRAMVYLKGATDRLGVACSFEAKESQEAAKVTEYAETLAAILAARSA